MRGTVPYAARYHGAQHVDTSGAVVLCSARAAHEWAPSGEAFFANASPRKPRRRASVGPGSIKGTPFTREGNALTSRAQDKKGYEVRLASIRSGASGPTLDRTVRCPVVNHRIYDRMSSVMGS